MLCELTNSGELDRKEFSVYIHGQVSQTRNFYRELKNNPDIDFDYHGGERDGDIFYWILTYGDEINDNLRKILRINSNKNVPYMYSA